MAWSRHFRLVAFVVLGFVQGVPAAWADGLKDQRPNADRLTWQGTLFGLSKPPPQVEAFILDLEAIYLAPKGLSLRRLAGSDLAKLMGYAIGESATRPGPVDVFDPRFKQELEAWITGVSVEFDRPHLAQERWRQIEEAAHGFYDAEMEAKYGHRQAAVAPAAAPASAQAWFDGLTPADREAFLQKAKSTGFANKDGSAYTRTQFAAVSQMIDAEMDRRNLSPEQRQATVQHLAATGEPAL